MMAELGVEPERVAYIGDSGGDMTVAHAAGCTAIGVTWGYRSVDVLKTAGADMLIDAPSQLYNVCSVGSIERNSDDEGNRTACNVARQR